MEESDHVFERAVLAALPDAVLVVDESVSVIWANPAAECLFGLRVEQAAGISGLDLVHPDDLAAAAASMISVQSKDVGTPVEIRVRAHDGWRLVEVIGRPLSEGQILLSLRDLTDRRLWEVAGNQAELARVIVQNAASMTLLVDADGTVRTSSGGLTRLLGVDQEIARGRPFTDLACAEDRQLLLDAMVAARPGEPALVEARLTRLAGDSVPFAFTIVDLRDDPTVLGLAMTSATGRASKRSCAQLFLCSRRPSTPPQTGSSWWMAKAGSRWPTSSSSRSSAARRRTRSWANPLGSLRRPSSRWPIRRDSSSGSSSWRRIPRPSAMTR